MVHLNINFATNMLFIPPIFDERYCLKATTFTQVEDLGLAEHISNMMADGLLIMVKCPQYGHCLECYLMWPLYQDCDCSLKVTVALPMVTPNNCIINPWLIAHVLNAPVVTNNAPLVHWDEDNLEAAIQIDPPDPQHSQWHVLTEGKVNKLLLQVHLACHQHTNNLQANFSPAEMVLHYLVYQCWDWAVSLYTRHHAIINPLNDLGCINYILHMEDDGTI